MKNYVKNIALIAVMAISTQVQAGFFDAVSDAVSGAANVVRDTAQGAVNVVRDATGTQPVNEPIMTQPATAQTIPTPPAETVFVEEEALLEPGPALNATDSVAPSAGQPSASQVVEPSVQSTGQIGTTVK